MAKRQLIIIPGLGDRDKQYRLFVPLWARLGFEVHIFVFGWEDHHLTIEAAQSRLLQFVDDMSTNVYVIGVSAGGTAAVNLLAARPHTVTKVITVCTPYTVVAERINRLLHQTSNRLVTNLAEMNDPTKTKILSVHAAFDQLVSQRASKPAGIAHKRLWSVGHAPTIIVALILYRHALKSFFLESPEQSVLRRR